MEIIFIIGSIQAIIFSFLLFSKKHKLLSDKILVIWFLIIAIHLISGHLYNSDIYSKYPFLQSVHVGFALLHGPFLFFYVDNLTNKYQKFRKAYLFHFIPFLVTILLINITFFFIQVTEIKLKGIILSIAFMQLISGPVYVGWILVLLKKYKKYIGIHYSYTEEIELKWLKNITLGLAGIWAVILIAFALWELFNLHIQFERNLIIYTAVTIFVFVIGYKGLKQSPVFLNPFDSNILSDLNKKKTQYIKHHEFGVSTNRKVSDINLYSNNVNIKTKESKKLDNNNEIDHNINTLLLYMENEKPYLEDKLMLSDIASATDILHYKLTNIFNNRLKTNFFNFVNSYRIEEVKEKFQNSKNDHFTILAIAFECGFSSKSSFNRIFKQMTNLTPSEYRKNC